ncbi:MAG: leucine-rich repeat protein, partial [Paludibacteraceae bacterium]|nr:leucine-rich repeat protein [Paludibacteraceae bacterium]
YTPNNIFANTNNCPIYVPAGSVDAYKAAENWSQYAGRITAIPTGVLPASFPDANFRTYVFNNFDTDKDGILSSAECEAVTNISVCTDSIATVQGIEVFPNLRLLSCDGSSEYVAATHSYLGFGQLTSLDLSNNLSLATLRCSYNLLTALDVSDNVALEYVACSHNQLSSLELGQNSKLRTLYCEYNQLTSLDVSNNPAFIDLQCQKNELTSLDVSNNAALQGLQCANNQLTTLDVSNNLALVYLNAYDNPLDTLFMASGQEIETLYKDSGTTIVYIGPASNEIWYNSTDGSVVEPFATDVFGVNIISNTYSDGKGVIVFDGPVTMVGDRAFDGCMSLSSVMLPSTIQQIGAYAFYDCSALQSINLPESVSVIGSYAFASCSSLQEITIPQAVNSIYGVFARCTGLTRFNGKFADASGRALISGTTLMAVASAGLTSFSVPEGIKYISAAVFSGRRNLSEITLPEGLLTIGNEAFMETGINSLVIPESVNYIGVKAFSGCSNLVSINLPENITTINGELFRWCEKLNAVVIPKSVTTIDSFAFSKCSSLTTLVIPANVASLGYESFSYCSSLQSLVFESAVPPTGGQAMMKNTTCPIYVPAASVDAYKTADDYWSGYANQIQPAAPLPSVVDLGLSVKWATFNLGASSPTGSGNSYAWGETQPKSSYSWENYKWCKGTENTLTKYCYDSTYGNEGYTDAKSTLDLADDAAAANLGGSWRMPTVDEYLELRNTSNCDWTWNENYQDSGVSGYVVTSKKEGYTD